MILLFFSTQSFYKPEYRPPGPVARALKVAPETEIFWAPRVVGLLNGFFGIVEQEQLTNCDERGFGIGGSCDGFGSLTPPSDVANRAQYLDELSILLTGGRLSPGKKTQILDAVAGQTDDTRAYEYVLELILTTPEYHSYANIDPFAGPPPQPAPKGPAGDDYKVVIHLMLFGGCDSFNVLVPRNTIKCAKLRNEYDFVRGEVGTKDSIFSTQTVPLEGDANLMGQPCSDFGVHYNLTFLGQMYNDSELAFLANVGILDNPVTKQDFRFKTRTPLFSHNSMTDAVNKLDPFNTNVGTGTLGRMADVLDEAGFQTGRTAVSSTPEALSGDSFEGSAIVAIDEDGVKRFIDPGLTNFETVYRLLNGNGTNAEQSGLYGNTWSSILQTSFQQTEELYAILTDPAYEPTTSFSRTGISRRMKLISQLINARVQRKVDRDFLYVYIQLEVAVSSIH
jgi:hypothetical protein